MSRSMTAAAIAACLIAVGCGRQEENGPRVGNGPSIQVRTCTDPTADDCQPCSQAGADGLSFRDPQGNSARRVRVSYREGPIVQWRFLQLDGRTPYRAVLAYDPDDTKSPNPEYPFADVYGAFDGTGDGPTFTVSAPQAPAEQEKVWPYSVHLYDTTQSPERLVACADPEIIIDP